jgi:nicotinamide-nucleotide amidase
MRAVVLSIGTELLRGDIIDTNAAFLARQLSQAGFLVELQVTVGDDLGRLTAVVRESLDRADVIVGTGGLGPTGDDLTREAIAAALDESLFVDESLVEEIEQRFASMRRRMPARNRKQAELIPSARPIHNPNGTAPGWLVQRDHCTIAVMPGPPGEMQPMWRDAVYPHLETLLPGHVAMRSLMTFGLGESAVEERIEPVIQWREEVTVATYAKANGVQVHVTARAATAREADELAEVAEGMLRERLGISVFGTGDATLADAIGSMLRQRHYTLGVMESVTGGEVASLITDVEGSSEYFVGGVIAYTRAVKALHGVDVGIMDRYGLISAETAASMAEAICRDVGGDAGIGVTGIAGATPVESKSPGTCYIAVSMEGTTDVREIRRPGSRATIKQYFAQCALDHLRRRLLRDGAS